MQKQKRPFKKEGKKLAKKLQAVVDDAGGKITVEEKKDWTTCKYKRKWQDEKTGEWMDEEFRVDWHGTPGFDTQQRLAADIKRGLEKLGMDSKEIRKQLLNRLIAGDEANISIFNEISARTRELAQLHRMLDKLEDME
jgi:hypothetical protein